MPRSNRNVAFQYFAVRAQLARRQGDSTRERAMREIVAEIQAQCCHPAPLHLVARKSGSFIKAGQAFVVCSDCQKLLQREGPNKGELIAVQEQ